MTIFNHINQPDTQYNSFHYADKANGFKILDLTCKMDKSIWKLARFLSERNMNEFSSYELANSLHNSVVESWLSDAADSFRVKPLTYNTLPRFSTKLSQVEFLDRCALTINQLFHMAAKDFGVRILHENVRLAEEDRNKIPSGWKMPTNIDCDVYSLYHLRIKGAIDFITGKIDSATYVIETDPAILVKQFQRVDHPESGDLIYYLNEKMIPIHAGVMKDTCTVISKWGRLPQVFEHPLHVCPYGDAFIVFRKS